MCNKLKNNTYSYKERLQLNFKEKTEIAEKANMFVNENKTYFFDVSTNVKFLSERVNKKVNVFTHSLDNLEVLSRKDNILVHSINGLFNKKNRYFYGTNAVNCFNAVKFDAAFLGAAAIKSDGIYYEDEEDAFIKRQAAKRSKIVILLAEHQKYETSAYCKGFNLNEMDIIIVDKISSEYFLNIIESNNIEINPKSLVIM